VEISNFFIVVPSCLLDRCQLGKAAE